MMTTELRPTSWIELSETALRANLKFLRRVIGGPAVFCSVVKADAYGHRIANYIPLAEKCGVRDFAVFSAGEASKVLEARTRSSSIMIMGSIDDQDLGWAIENEIAFFVFDLARLDAAIRTAKKLGRRAQVHLEVETGLLRTGFSESGLKTALRHLAANPRWVEAVGLCTHFCGAESSASFYRITEQFEIFRRRAAQIAQAGHSDLKQHVACSAAIFNYPDSVLDLVRVGIAQYGYWPSEETRLSYLHRGARRQKASSLRLVRVLAWKCRVMSLKVAAPGAFIGYGLSYQAFRKMRLATVPVGYSHGFPRAQSNVGHVLIHGQRCRVVGTVNMNMLTVDVTDLDGVRPGDEVVLIGRQGDEEISVGAFGEQTHNLNYEVLVRISAHIPRVVVP
ncbi:MAG: alanine racemase [Planctomycetes bacterium]|nr:alanine racemase [Planctomycetota bacterium]